MRDKQAADAAPWVDFSIFTAVTFRSRRRLTFQALSLSADGVLRPKELAGPPNYTAWFESYRVFRTACLLLDYCSPSSLDIYSEHVRRLADKYAWQYVCQGDIRMRCEQWERIRRDMELTSQRGVSWSQVLMESTKKDSFWSAEVREPYLLAQSTRGNRGAQGSRDPPPADLQAATSERKRAKRPNRRPRDGARGSGRDPHGRQVCFRWNREDGACEAVCPQGRVHSCESCGGAHRKVQCA